jgi:hypothetical protein
VEVGRALREDARERQRDGPSVGAREGDAGGDDEAHAAARLRRLGQAGKDEGLDVGDAAVGELQERVGLGPAQVAVFVLEDGTFRLQLQAASAPALGAPQAGKPEDGEHARGGPGFPAHRSSSLVRFHRSSARR